MQKLIGKNINLRLVEIDDAEFILNLRLEKGKFLSNTNPRILFYYRKQRFSANWNGKNL